MTAHHLSATHRTRVKICGLTREEDVDAAVQAGADAVGFVFYAQSARHVSVSRAATLARRLPPFVTPMALFVNPSAAEVQSACDALGAPLLQFHGDETPTQCEALAGPGRLYLRAARMAPGLDLLDYCHQFAKAQAVLLDAHVDGYGGAGQVFDWSLIPSNVPLPIVLSGGLNAANVADAIARVRPWAIDVSSGVESSKGIKDAARIRAFMAAVREADAQAALSP